ncbi:MAG: hypothetical protein EOQ39_22525 [Mesorhizobium sp.]|uniref:hypothetical protein n=1 Tax=Mesorhizobium sp. TaxID=1871066 RepID=UPI000FE72502|nr:hypothetical protein [Mesorhizobium sp.]RWB05449.1 MAG: hypothetical protein EOQ37_14385 [Mesorhizobium sp.]RWB12580.1 MAG: hypothetical protein EOQ39_22525 [Mesorhizobium sp.]
MQNTRVLAAAEGLPEISRRRLLLGLAAASTAAAALTVAPAAHAATPVENPELVRLGNALAAIADEYRTARDARIAIIDKWSKVWPLAPDEIILDRKYGSDEIERDLTGSGLYRKGSDRALAIYSCRDLEWYLTRAKRILKGKTIDKRAVGGLPDRAAWEDSLDQRAAEYTAAAKYEAEKARILKVSSYEAANRRKQAAAVALIDAIDGIMAQPETTMAGVMIKAQALATWGLVTDWQRMLTPKAAAWGPALGASVLRMAGEA